MTNYALNVGPRLAYSLLLADLVSVTLTVTDMICISDIQIVEILANKAIWAPYDISHSGSDTARRLVAVGTFRRKHTALLPVPTASAADMLY